MPDTPTAYPPPQLVITYSGGRYHVDVAGEEGQKAFPDRAAMALYAYKWACDMENAQ